MTFVLSTRYHFNPYRYIFDNREKDMMPFSMQHIVIKIIDETILRIGKLASRICCSNYILINSRFMGI